MEKTIQWVDPDFPQQKNPHSRWLNAIIALETHEHPLITLYGYGSIPIDTFLVG